VVVGRNERGEGGTATRRVTGTMVMCRRASADYGLTSTLTSYVAMRLVAMPKGPDGMTEALTRTRRGSPLCSLVRNIATGAGWSA